MHLTRRTDELARLARRTDEPARLARRTDEPARLTRRTDELVHLTRRTDELARLARRTDEPARLARRTNEPARLARRTDELARLARRTDELARLARRTDELARLARRTDELARLARRTDELARLARRTDELAHRESVRNLSAWYKTLTCLGMVCPLFYDSRRASSSVLPTCPGWSGECYRLAFISGVLVLISRRTGVPGLLLPARSCPPRIPGRRPLPSKYNPHRHVHQTDQWQPGYRHRPQY